MPLEIYSEVPRERAVAAFASVRRPQSFIDGVFVVLDHAVLCFLTVGTVAGASFLTPRSLRWCPPGGPVRGGDLNWWPRAVVDVYDRPGPTVRRLREHHVFLQSSTAPAFLYAGPAHLGGHGADRTADFERSPEMAWASSFAVSYQGRTLIS